MTSSRYPTCPVLIIDDEPVVLQGCTYMLQASGIDHLESCDTSAEVPGRLNATSYSAILLDLSMPPPTGEELLADITRQHPDIPVIIITGLNDIDTAIRCMKAGAFDYLVKPVEEARLSAAVKRAIELHELRNEYQSFKDRVLSRTLETPSNFESIITTSQKMYSLFQYIETVASSPHPVLITGETGTGKELIARALHDSRSCDGDFIAVNVAGVDDLVFSDTLFGHVKGAYTGADAVRAGLIEKAKDGTLFLDEIGELSSASQIKLLRLLQEREYYPLGADAPRRSAARIVVATNRRLTELIRDGAFRSDLYYRLQMHKAEIPPLRDRQEDIPCLTKHFVTKTARQLNRKAPSIPREVMAMLSCLAYPGNVRELEAMVVDAVSQCRARHLRMDHFRIQPANPAVDLASLGESSPAAMSPFTLFNRLPRLDEAPGLLIEEALKRTGGNQTLAARLLGISRSGLSKAMKRRDMPLSTYRERN